MQLNQVTPLWSVENQMQYQAFEKGLDFNINKILP
jgi:hypothetical protein